MKKILTSCVAIALLVSTLAGCSAYKNPAKYIKAPAKGSVTISAAEIAKQLQEKIDSILEEERAADYKEVTDAEYKAQKGDQVTILYTGTPRDEELKKNKDILANMTNVGKADDKTDDQPYDLVLGSDSFIGAYENKDKPEKNNKGFEEQLIGCKKGDKVTVTVTFPDDYKTKELQGQVADFAVEVQKISNNIIDDKSTVTVNYEFSEVKAEEEETEKDETTEGTEDTPVAQADTAEDTADNKDESSGDKKEETATKAKFEDLFKSGKFNIDYTAAIDGKFNTIFNIKDYSDSFKGKYVYYEETVKYTVPTDVEEKFKDYAGAEIEIKFSISDVTSLPEWNDEFVKEYTTEEYKTVAEYKVVLEDTIKQDLAYEAILAATEVVKWPKSEVEKTYKTQVDALVSEKLEGKSPNSFTQSQLKEILTKDVYDKIYAQAASQAYAAVKERLVVEYLIDELEIEMSNKEYKEKRAEYYKEYAIYFQYYYGVTSEKALEQYYGKEALKLQFLTEKLYEKIVEYVTIGE